MNNKKTSPSQEVAISLYPEDTHDRKAFNHLVSELESDISQRLKGSGAGGVDGHEIATDSSHAVIRLKGGDARALFRDARDALMRADYVSKAVLLLTFHDAEGGSRKEEYVIEPGRDYLAEYRQELPVVFDLDLIGLEDIAEHAPGLLPLACSLLPFRDLIGSMQVMPQPWAGDHSPGEPPAIYFHITPSGDGVERVIHCTPDSVLCTEVFTLPDGRRLGEDYEITLAQLFEYLRQLPRPIHSFCRGARGGPEG